MSRKNKSFNRNAIFLAASAVGLTVPAWGDVTSVKSGVALTATWPNSLTYVNDPPLITSNPGNTAGLGAPDNGGNAVAAETLEANKLEAETFTPASNFNLGAISFVESGGTSALGASDTPVQFSMHLFELRSGLNGASTGYQPEDGSGNINIVDVNGGPNGYDLLGGGNGVNFTVPVVATGPAPQVMEFDFNNNAANGGTNDQVALQAGVTYALEIWGPASDPSFQTVFFNRTSGSDSNPQPYAGGQVLWTGSTAAAGSFAVPSTVDRGQVAGGARQLLFAVYPVPGSNQVTPTWIATGGGSWTTNPANWQGGIIPNGVGNTAAFAGSILANSTVTLDGAVTVGAINITNTTNSYTLAAGAGGTLILDNGGSTATATVTNGGGQHFISAPIVLNSTGSFIATNPGDVLTLSGNISGASFLSGGAGTVVLSGTNTYAGGGAQLTGGTLRVGSNGALSTGSPINVTTGATLDLNGFSPTAGTLFGDGTIDNVAGGGSSVFTNGNGGTGNSTFSGHIQNTTGIVGIDYTGTGTLTLSPRTTANTYSGTTTVTSGAIVIAQYPTTSSPLVGLPTGGKVVNNSLFSIQAGATQIVAGNISGSGTLQVGVTGGTAGLLQLATGSGADTQGMVTVASGSTLDITNNKLTINYGSAGNDPVAAIAADLASGRNGGAWNGVGIISSAIANAHFAIGYADGDSSDSATGLQPNQLIVKYTLAGDATLSNSVGIGDLLVVAQNFGKTGKDWAHGNFNYDPSGAVGIADLLTVAQNFSKSSGVSQSEDGFSSAWQALSSQVSNTIAVPEPTSLALVGLGVAGLLSRRRRVARPI